MENITKTGMKVDCSAFCPECGTDLYYIDGVCFCKNEDCAYKCDKCKKEKDELYFGENEKMSD